MIKLLGEEEKQELCYNRFLENPLVFLLFSRWEWEEIAALKLFWEDLERCIVVQACYEKQEQFQTTEIINLEITDCGEGREPNFDSRYLLGMENAIRRVKLHKYNNENDIVVCVMADSWNDCAVLEKICGRMYRDFMPACYDRVLFDFYFLISEEFIPNTIPGQKTDENLKSLKHLAENEWVRYIFFLSDLTNEGRLIGDRAKLFQAVRDSVALTNCHSSAGVDSAFINRLLTDEASAWKSKFLVLGQMELYLNKSKIRKIIRHELLEEICRTDSADAPNIRMSPVRMEGIFKEVQKMISDICHAAGRIACYENITLEQAAQDTYYGVMYHCFRNNPEKFIQHCRDSLREKLGKALRDFCQEQLSVSLNDALLQTGTGIYRKHCGEEVFRSAVEDIRKYRLQNEEKRKENEKKLSEWKNRKVQTGSRGCRRGYQYQILEQWIDFQKNKLTGEFYEQCLQETECYIYKWIKEIEGKCRYFMECRVNASNDLDEMLTDCNWIERNLIQTRRQAVREYLEKHPENVRQCGYELNGMLEKPVDFAYLNKRVWELTDWLYFCQMKNSGMYGSLSVNPSQYAEFYDELMIDIKDHASLYTRWTIPNVEPHIFLLGNKDNSFISYAEQKGELQGFLFDSEYLKYPTAFFYQNVPAIERYTGFQAYYGEDGGSGNVLGNPGNGQ